MSLKHQGRENQKRKIVGNAMANDWLYRQYFDDKGNWKKPHDPYRDNKSKFYKVFLR